MDAAVDGLDIEVAEDVDDNFRGCRSKVCKARPPEVTAAVESTGFDKGC